VLGSSDPARRPSQAARTGSPHRGEMLAGAAAVAYMKLASEAGYPL